MTMRPSLFAMRYLSMLGLLLSLNTYADNKPMKIRLLLDNKSIAATLYNNPQAEDFIKLLPLSLSMENYADERIAYLPRKLSNQSAPDGSTPKVGDFSYYAPWGNLAIFLKDFRYSKGLLPLGKIEDNLELLTKNGPFTLRIELIANE